MTRMRNNEHHIIVWNNGGTELLYLFPRHAHPGRSDRGYMGPDYALWYASGGTQGTKPDDPNILKICELFREAAGQKADERNKNAQEIWKILVDQQYRHRHGRPVAGRAGRAAGAEQAGQYRRRGSASRSIAARRAVRIRKPGTTRADASRPRRRPRTPASRPPGGRLARWRAITGIVADHAGRRSHPASGAAAGLSSICPSSSSSCRRATSSMPTSQARRRQSSGRRGGGAAPAYGLDQPLWVQYFKWISLVAQRRFRPVVRIWPAGHRGDRRPALADHRCCRSRPIIVTWGLALPIGIYSAVRQYSIGDYVFTLHRLHRAGGAEFPAGADRDVFRLRAGSTLNVGGLFSAD